MSPYAENTQVAAGRSRAEIERTLRRYGADAFIYGWDGPRAIVRFRAKGRYVQFEIPMPDRDAREFTHTPGRDLRRSPSQIEAAWEQATRQRWRALALVIKAKLEAVESEITTFEQEFLAHTVLPDGQTVSDWILPQVELAYEKGTMPKMLPEATA